MAREKKPPTKAAMKFVEAAMEYAASDVEDVHYNLGGTRYTCNVGMGILGKHRFTIGGNEVTIELEDGRQKTWKKKGAKNPWIEFDVSDEDQKKTEQLEFVAATGFDGELTLDRETVRRLGLLEIPGKVFLASVWSREPILCTKALVRIRVPELDLDMTCHAAVLPVDGPTL